MREKALIPVVIAAVISVAVSSCTKQKLQATFNNQETSIEKYLDTQIKRDTNSVIIRNGGSNRLVTTPGTGEELRPGGTVVFHYAGYTFSGSISPSNLFATNDSTSAKSAGWADLSGIAYQPDTLVLNRDNFITGLYNGLSGVRAGEECQIIFSGKYGFGSKNIGTVSANSALAYYFWIKSVKNN